MKKLIAVSLTALCSFCYTQTTKEEIFADPNKSGGVYYAYPNSYKKQTPTPKGYEAFYLSHYGRHGSRWLINDSDFFGALKILRNAKKSNVLTKNGENALQKLEQIWKIAEGHNGDLTPLGQRQQIGIGQRMTANYPNIFSGNSKIDAKSTIVPRCILSMANLTNELIRFNPKIEMNQESSDKYMKFLNHHTKESNDFRSQDNNWQEEKRKFVADHIKPARFINNLFSDSDYVYKNVNPDRLMKDFYWIAVDMQNLDTDISFYDLFTKEELFDIWQGVNYQTYVNDGPSPLSNNLVKNNAIPLVKNIISEADNYISNNQKGANLRFGHDGNIAPLLALMRIEGMDQEETDPKKVYQIWSTYKAAPMAGNLQMVFFKNKKGDDVIVKFLLHENEVKIPVKTDSFPYYNWKDVRNYLVSITQ